MLKGSSVDKKSVGLDGSKGTRLTVQSLFSLLIRETIFLV